MANPSATAADDKASGDQAASSPVSVIGSDIVINGNIDATVDLHIEGKVVGDVQCQTLILGSQSTVDGNIRAERVRVSGTVKGSIETRDLAIEASASVTGDVVYERIRIANGGSLEGTLRRTSSEEGSTEAARLKLVQPADPKTSEQSPIYID